MAFFGHFGNQYSGYTALSASSFGALLNDIAADVGNAVSSGTANGWSLWDDQRYNSSALIVSVPGCGGLNLNSSYSTFGVTSASLSMTVGNNGTNNSISAQFITGGPGTGTMLTFNTGTTFYNIGTTGTQVYNVALDRPYAQVTSLSNHPQERVEGYIVLKCSSSMKSFYVGLFRPHSYGHTLHTQIFETWDNSTHSGTNPGPQEFMRAYQNGMVKNSGTSVRYGLWLLPDSFAVWTGGNPYTESIQSQSLPYTDNNIYSDFFYCGNLIPFRQNDTNGCIIQACSCQNLSGLGVVAGASTTYGIWHGGAPMMRTVDGTVWNDIFSNGPTDITKQYSSFPAKNVYTIWPRSRTYLHFPYVSILDEQARMQICDIEVYQGGGFTQYQAWEGKRGDIRYLKYPMYNPSTFEFQSFTANDGNTYVIVKSSYNQMFDNSAQVYLDAQLAIGNRQGSGFSFASPLNTTTTAGDIIYGVNQTGFLPRYFLLPINI